MLHDRSMSGHGDEMIAGISERPHSAMASAAFAQRRRETDLIMEALLREYYMAAPSRPSCAPTKLMATRRMSAF